MVSTLRKGILLALATILLTVFVSGAIAETEVRNPLALDMVVVLDISKSMKNPYDIKATQCDPDGLRFAAASALISMCDTEYSRAEFFLFTGDKLYKYDVAAKPDYIREIQAGDLSLGSMSILSNGTTRASFLRDLNTTDQGNGKNNINAGWGSTDDKNIGYALNAAVNLLCRDTSSQNRKVIVLFSDGVISNSARKQESSELTTQAKEKAEENGIEVYTISLNQTNVGQTLLVDAATDELHYSVATDQSSMLKVFNRFYADMIGSVSTPETNFETLDDGTGISINIPNNSVSEMNIIIPRGYVSNAQLCRPDGTPVTDKDQDALVNDNHQFLCYKAIKPKAGDWKLLYNAADSKQNIPVQYIFSYNVQTTVKLDTNKVSKNKPVELKAYYMENGLPTTDNALYNIPGTAIVYSEPRMGNDPLLIKDLVNAGDHYECSIDSLDQAGDYSVEVIFDGAGLRRQSEPITFAKVNDAPVLVDEYKKGEPYNVDINIPREADSYETQSNSWDLKKFVTDPNGDEVVFSISNQPEGVNAELIGKDNLKITTIKNQAAQTEVRVTSADKEGLAGPELVFPVTVVNVEDGYNSYTAEIAPIENAQKNSTYTISVTVKNGNGVKDKTDKNLPDSCTATVQTKNGTSSDIELTRQSNGCWEGQLTTGNKEDNYTLNVIIPYGQNGKKITCNADVAVGNQPPKLIAGKTDTDNWKVNINNPGNDETYNNQTKTWTLSELVADPNGDDVTFALVSNGQNVDASVSNETKVLTVTSKLNTAADEDIVVTCEDNDGLAGPQLTFHIKVNVVDAKYDAYYAEITSSKTTKNDLIPLTLTLYDHEGEGQTIIKGDPNLPQTVEVTVKKGADTFPLTMQLGDNGKWTTDLKTGMTEEVFTINGEIQIGSRKTIKINEHKINTANQAPVKVQDLSTAVPAEFRIEPFLLWNDATGEITIDDLNAYFTDPDGDPLTFSYQCDREDAADITIEGSKLTINANTASVPVSFTVTAKDGEGLEVTSDTVTFTAVSLKKQGILTLAEIAAALVAILILYNICKPKFHSQKFDVILNSQKFETSQNTLKGKEKKHLDNYCSAELKRTCQEIKTESLKKIEIYPAYRKAVKVKLTGDTDISATIGAKKLDTKKKKRLEPNGMITITKPGNNGLTLAFRLIDTTPRKPVAGAKPKTGKPAKPGTAAKPGTGFDPAAIHKPTSRT